MTQTSLRKPLAFTYLNLPKLELLSFVIADALMSAFDQQKWDAKYSAAETTPTEPSAVLMTLANYLPNRGRALDIAGGAGRNALWLARRGLDVTIADVSSVGLALARQRAAEKRLNLQTLQIDFEQQPLIIEPFDLILSVCYLWRPLFAQFPRLLNPGGILLVIQPTKRNLERNEKPPAPYLLDEGELPHLVIPTRSVSEGFPTDSLEILHYQEDWFADNRHDAVCIARKNYRASDVE